MERTVEFGSLRLYIVCTFTHWQAYLGKIAMGYVPEVCGYAACQSVASSEPQPFQVSEFAQARWDLPAKTIVVEGQPFQFEEVTQLRRDLTGQDIRFQVQSLQFKQLPQLWRIFPLNLLLLSLKYSSKKRLPSCGGISP